MKKQFVIIGLIFVLTIVSCVKKDYATDVQITNQSNQDLGKIELYAVGSQKSEILLIREGLLNKNGKIERSFSEKSLPNSDGSYLVKIEEKSKLRNSVFGYFTNGISMDASINITVKPDTILVETITRRDGY